MLVIATPSSRRLPQRLCASVLALLVLVTLAPGIERRDGKAAHAMDHCPLCSLQPDLTGPVPAPELTLATPLLSRAMPALFYTAPRPLQAWAAVQARAPPALA
jgi:hypothetical protein